MIARLSWNDGLTATLRDDLVWETTPKAPEVLYAVRNIFRRESAGLHPSQGAPEIVATKRIIEILQPDSVTWDLSSYNVPQAPGVDF